MSTKKDYSSWSKDELVRELKKVEKIKKYGIVWEDKPEQVAELCKEKLPVLEEDKHREIKTDELKPVNIFIEGDNYHALSVLNYTHKGAVDVIYIDPPYNTGARDWKYNNDYVDINDQWRHSKWLSFMDKRLRLAKNLLSSNGILICAIDDNEFASLKLLLEEIMPSYTHETVVVNHHPQGSGGLNISATHEYAIVSVPNGKNLFLGDYIENEVEAWSLIKAGAGRDYYRIGRPRMFFAIYVDKKTGEVKGIGPEVKMNEKYPTEDTKEGHKRVYPLDSNGKERRWRYGRESMENLIQKKEIKASLPKFSMNVIKTRNNVFKPIYSNWVNSKYNAGPHGTMFLKEILSNTNFPFPKSIYTVMDFIASATRINKDAIVLDFFAGSGTTGHAVLKLNKEDGGNRKFILCTNNEGNICADVCYPRVEKVMKGYSYMSKKTAGLGGNLKYFQTDFVDAEPTDKNKRKLVDKSTEMLCLKEDCFDESIKGKSFRMFTNGQNKHLGIIYDDDGIEPFKKEVKKLNKKFVVYVFSLDDSAREEEFEDVTRLVELRPIPAVILNVYRRIFK